MWYVDWSVREAIPGLRQMVETVWTSALKWFLAHKETIFLVICVVVILWIFLEVMFYVSLVFFVLPKLRRRKRPPAYPIEPTKCMKRMVDWVEKLDCYSPEKFIAGFFRGAEIKDLRYGNMHAFLAWAMFAKHHQELNKTECRQVQSVFAHIKKRFNKHFTHDQLSGHNPEVHHVQLSLEPKIPYIHRPLALYVLNELFETTTSNLTFRTTGFHRLEMNGIYYWYRPGKGVYDIDTLMPGGRTNFCSADKLPLLFLHGITPGWAFYMAMVSALARSADRALILVDLDAIRIKSMVFTMPTPEQFVDVISRIMQRHRFKMLSIAGHSFGSITAAWILRMQPQLVGHLTLIDPVSLLLALPDVAFSFLYRKPSKFTEYVIYYWAAKEVTISHTLHRHFWWYKNCLWLEDVPKHIGIVVGLAGADEIVNSEAVREYVERCREDRKRFARKQQVGNFLRKSASRNSLSRGSSMASLQKAEDEHQVGRGDTGAASQSNIKKQAVSNDKNSTSSFGDLGDSSNNSIKKAKSASSIQALNEMFNRSATGKVSKQSVPPHDAREGSISSLKQPNPPFVRSLSSEALAEMDAMHEQTRQLEMCAMKLKAQYSVVSSASSTPRHTVDSSPTPDVTVSGSCAAFGVEDSTETNKHSSPSSRSGSTTTETNENSVEIASAADIATNPRSIAPKTESSRNISSSSYVSSRTTTVESVHSMTNTSGQAVSSTTVVEKSMRTMRYSKSCDGFDFDYQEREENRGWDLISFFKRRQSTNKATTNISSGESCASLERPQTEIAESDSGNDSDDEGSDDDFDADDADDGDAGADSAGFGKDGSGIARSVAIRLKNYMRDGVKNVTESASLRDGVTHSVGEFRKLTRDIGNVLLSGLRVSDDDLEDRYGKDRGLGIGPWTEGDTGGDESGSVSMSASRDDLSEYTANTTNTTNTMTTNSPFSRSRSNSHDWDCAQGAQAFASSTTPSASSFPSPAEREAIKRSNRFTHSYGPGEGDAGGMHGSRALGGAALRGGGIGGGGNSSKKQRRTKSGKLNVFGMGGSKNLNVHVADIKCVYWEGNFHGQILIPGQQNMRDFAELVAQSERDSTLTI